MVGHLANDCKTDRMIKPGTLAPVAGSLVNSAPQRSVCRRISGVTLRLYTATGRITSVVACIIWGIGRIIFVVMCSVVRSPGWVTTCVNVGKLTTTLNLCWSILSNAIGRRLVDARRKVFLYRDHDHVNRITPQVGRVDRNI